MNFVQAGGRIVNLSPVALAERQRVPVRQLRGDVGGLRALRQAR